MPDDKLTRDEETRLADLEGRATLSDVDRAERDRLREIPLTPRRSDRVRGGVSDGARPADDRRTEQGGGVYGRLVDPGEPEMSPLSPEAKVRLDQLRAKNESELTAAERNEMRRLSMSGGGERIGRGMADVGTVVPLTDEERARLTELRDLPPAPSAGPRVRTEAEEAELAKLADAEREAARVAAIPRPVPSPKDRLAELQAKKPHPLFVVDPDIRTEGEEREMRLLAERFADEDRLKVLRAQPVQTAAEVEEMRRLTDAEAVRLAAEATR